MVASGELKAPIVIGRDHLDCGSVASPYRETEAMLDGSDAIADWAILNALVNTASGATWVSFHHGGGVGMGRSLHAGQVTVADGTELAAQKIERVLTNDPGMGVIRHVDAGYDRAVEVAEERGCGSPSRGVAARPGRAMAMRRLSPTVRTGMPSTCMESDDGYLDVLRAVLGDVFRAPRASGGHLLQANPHWLRDPATRTAVGGVYLAFLLPGADGAVRAGRRRRDHDGLADQLRRGRRGRPGDHAAGAAAQPAVGRRRHPQPGVAVVLYALVAVVGVVPEVGGWFDLKAIQVEAILLILLVLLAHGLVWRFMTSEPPGRHEAMSQPD